MRYSVPSPFSLELFRFSELLQLFWFISINEIISMLIDYEMIMCLYLQTSGHEGSCRLAGPGSQWTVVPRIIIINYETFVYIILMSS